MQLTVTDAFWSLFPDAQIGLVIAHGIDNTRATEQTAALLTGQIEQTARALEGAEIASSRVAAWA